MNPHTKHHLIAKIKSRNLIKAGAFKLKSGLDSTLYFDFKGVMSYPTLLADISYELSKLVKPNGVLCGVPYGGIPYAVQISQLTSDPMILLRDEKKSYGMCKQIEGELFGRDIILIEDVITTGSSVLETIAKIEKCGVKIKQIVCILDRQIGGVEAIREKGYDVDVLLTLTDCVSETPLPKTLTVTNDITSKLISIINFKKSNLIASLDVTNTEKLFSVLDLIGPHICAVKIHYDILDADIVTFTSRIIYLKDRHKFLIIEDRKFSDIPAICLKQLDRIERFADIVTVHGICGESVIAELNSRSVGLLPVHQLSVAGNLIDRTYSNKVLDMCKSYKNVVGFVSQEKVPGWLTFSPGIQNNRRTDQMGQTYKPVAESESDVFIVGRGIYESPNILEATIRYQSACMTKWTHN